MTITVTPERKARCRMLDGREERCPNEALDPDPKAPQICGRHALEAAQLLEAAGVVRIKFGPFITRRSA